MDNQRLLIWGLFALLAWVSYQTWVQDYAPKPVVAPAEQALPPTTDEAGGDLPALAAPTDGVLDAPLVADPAVLETPATTPDAASIRVTTDVFSIEISTKGGTLQSATLLGYPVTKDQPDRLIELLSAAPSSFGAIQTGLRIVGEGDEPNHRAMFSSSSSVYDMGAADELIVPMRWQSAAGVTVEKRFRFTRGSYAVVIEQEVSNGGEGLWRGTNYAQIQRTSKEQERSMFDVDSYSFDGSIIYNGEKSEKLAHDDLIDDGPVTFSAQNGWLGAIQHHFLSALVPEAGTTQSYSVSVRDNRSSASMIGQAQSVAPGSSRVFTTVAFVGPKLQAQLEEIDETLKLTVDYGWLTIISQPLFWVLRHVFDLVGNWGVAIILVTLMIKLVFYKLTESSGRSMAKMRNLQPRMKALQDRYKDDKPALSQAMMDLYKREKVNPAAGCLPILIQMPFFLAFYWVLLESVEMRQAPFALWITDLSTKDPFFILPLIMGAAMFMQQKLNPAPADPMQAKVMQIMPIMFTAFFAFFPSGLVLYWVTNTLLSIAQQWKINTVVAQEAKDSKR